MAQRRINPSIARAILYSCLLIIVIIFLIAKSKGC